MIAYNTIQFCWDRIKEAAILVLNNNPIAISICQIVASYPRSNYRLALTNKMLYCA